MWMRRRIGSGIGPKRRTSHNRRQSCRYFDGMMTDQKPANEVAGAYDRWAASYDADKNATRDLDALVMRRSPIALEGRDVLELGCGTGKNTSFLAEHAKSVLAMDFSEGMIARAH